MPDSATTLGDPPISPEVPKMPPTTTLTASQSTASEVRLHRIDELQMQSLQQEDPLQANLGAANGALLRFGYRMEQAIEDVLQQSANPLERFERLAPAIDMYLKVMRQVDRFAQLDQRLTAKHTPSG